MLHVGVGKRPEPTSTFYQGAPHGVVTVLGCEVCDPTRIRTDWQFCIFDRIEVQLSGPSFAIERVHNEFRSHGSKCLSIEIDAKIIDDKRRSRTAVNASE